MKQFAIWKRRIAYGSTDMAGNMIWQMVSMYLLFFYTRLLAFRQHSLPRYSWSCGVLMRLTP